MVGVTSGQFVLIPLQFLFLGLLFADGTALELRCFERTVLEFAVEVETRRTRLGPRLPRPAEHEFAATIGVRKQAVRFGTHKAYVSVRVGVLVLIVGGRRRLRSSAR